MVGKRELSQWVTDTFKSAREGITREEQIRNISSAAIIETMLAASAVAGREIFALRLFDESSKDVKTTGLWLRAYPDTPKTIASELSVIAFYANGDWVPFPYTDSEATAAKHLGKRQVNFVVLLERRHDRASEYLNNWVLQGINDHSTELVYEERSQNLGLIRIYRWRRP